jgi:aspartyl-tRNA(Asn)/glutamyl-tRNA(Gln) amidotransferase subunit A
MMPALTDLSLLQAISGLRQGDFSSQELVQACLDRIHRVDPLLQAFLSLNPQRALAQAGAADRKVGSWRRNPREHLPILTGIPLAVKDVLCVEGFPCTCGSRILQGFEPPYTATAVERLISAGAVVVGKTNTDEFAMGSSTENSAYFTTRNPWNPAHVPGGSSGGSAAAVAARLVPAALGTDTGGSIRQPASYCGVTGLKPTYGRVSRFGLAAYGSSLDTVGVFSRSAEDTALLFSLMAGPDPLDATSTDQPVPVLPLGPGFRPWNVQGHEGTSHDYPLAGLKVGVPAEYFIEGIQPEVEAKVRQAIAALEELGADIRPVNLPHTEYALPVYYLIAPAEASANLARYDGVRYGPRLAGETMWEGFYQTRGEFFGPEVKRRIMLGTYALSAGYYDAYYGQAQKVRTLIRRDFDLVFQEVDVIAAPVAPTTAFRIGEHAGDPLSMYLEDVFTLPANLAGIPGLAFPVGFDQAGLPVGMQIMGAHNREDILLQAAHVYQQNQAWHLDAPDL